MQLTPFGHACVLVEHHGAQVLIDPGVLSSGFESLTGLAAIAVSHEHPDHLDAGAIREVLDANPETVLLAHPTIAGEFGDQAVAVAPGARWEGGGLAIQVGGGVHADVFPGVPGTPNLTFFIEGAGFYHPGDSFDSPPAAVEVAALPVQGPWAKLSDAAEFLARVRPPAALPIHMGDLVAPPHSLGILALALPEGTRLLAPEQGVTLSL